MMSDDRSNNGMFAGGLKPPSYNDFQGYDNQNLTPNASNRR